MSSLVHQQPAIDGSDFVSSRHSAETQLLCKWVGFEPFSFNLTLLPPFDEWLYLVDISCEDPYQWIEVRDRNECCQPSHEVLYR